MSKLPKTRGNLHFSRENGENYIIERKRKKLYFFLEKTEKIAFSRRKLCNVKRSGGASDPLNPPLRLRPSNGLTVATLPKSTLRL